MKEVYELAQQQYTNRLNTSTTNAELSNRNYQNAMGNKRNVLDANTN
ncbi:MAG: hypothetical protein SR3Q1_10575 [Quinella sp. 3Q1]|nr:hypothetical protein [Quinella sp. 3Q1]MBR3049984.1 hypothetical protein [Selenomonadaceae bacterium]MBR6888300.1 hypothetical protein [Selenomonadaceae bacterium]